MRKGENQMYEAFKNHPNMTFLSLSSRSWTGGFAVT